MKVSIKFSLASGKASDLPIRIRVSYDGARLDLRTGLVCPPEFWDDASMRMMPGTMNRYGERAALVNAKLSKQEADINNILTKYELEGKDVEPSDLKNEFDALQGRKVVNNDCTLLTAYDRFLSDRTGLMQPSTINLHITTKGHISRLGLASVPIDRITKSDINGFKQRLIDEGYENSTIDLYVSRIKSVLRWGKKNGLYNGNLHETYSSDLRNVHKDVNYLEWSEFLAIYNLTEFKNDNYRMAHAMFCLCCTTGLRISDCMALKWDNVSFDNNHIHLVAKKTKKQTIIELNDYSLAILERQKGISAGSDRVFPSANTSSLRYSICKIAEMAGLTRKIRRMSINGSKVQEEYVEIHKAISSHWGRHTFVVRALSLGISPAIVMSWTGHSNFDSMKPYVQIASVEKAKCMNLFNDGK